MAERIKLSWTDDAKAELRELYLKIAHHDKPAAQRLVSKLRDLARGLQDHPKIGRVVPEYEVQNVRERIYGNYRLIYLLSRRGIEIIANGTLPSCTTNKGLSPESRRILFQLFHGCVSINLGGSDTPVAGYFLDGGHRSPGGGQSGQARVTERVGRGPEIQIRDFTVPFDDLLNGPDGQRPMFSVTEQRSRRSDREPAIPIELDQFFDTSPSGSI